MDTPDSTIGRKFLGVTHALLPYGFCLEGHDASYSVRCDGTEPGRVMPLNTAQVVHYIKYTRAGLLWTLIPRASTASNFQLEDHGQLAKLPRQFTPIMVISGADIRRAQDTRPG
ncbi:hypothetical protein RRG08_032623 [Elysia crispata]|uniref:Uncharacterized protein n=1 Tax=Elysia crispata TaxID=231223 RepID=A0AAE1CQK8_9GAST|nr:hypothetical protein RRG08_032623 [Elysia crispata]